MLTDSSFKKNFHDEIFEYKQPLKPHSNIIVKSNHNHKNI